MLLKALKISNLPLDPLRRHLGSIESVRPLTSFSLPIPLMRVKCGKSVIDVKMKEFLQAVEQERKTLENKLEKKKYEAMKVNEKWRESKMEFETKLKERDDEMQALHRQYEKESGELKSRVKDLEHKVALQEKDIEIKTIELKHERSKVEPQPPARSSPTSDLDFLADNDDDDYYHGNIHPDDF